MKSGQRFRSNGYLGTFKGCTSREKGSPISPGNSCFARDTPVPANHGADDSAPPISAFGPRNRHGNCCEQSLLFSLVCGLHNDISSPESDSSLVRFRHCRKPWRLIWLGCSRILCLPPCTPSGSPSRRATWPWRAAFVETGSRRLHGAENTNVNY